MPTYLFLPMSRCAVPENDDERHEYGPAARSHSSGATPAEKQRHVADVAVFDARELGGRYRALRERVPCRSRYLPNK